MKNLLIAIISVLALTFSNTIFAQPMDKNVPEMEKVNDTNAEEFAILENFKATKTQKRVIKKMKRYVTPKVMAGKRNTAALEGKKVRVQLTLDTNGNIANMQIVKGFEESLDARVLKFIKEYDSKKPLANSKLDKPTTIQFNVNLVGKKQYMN